MGKRIRTDKYRGKSAKKKKLPFQYVEPYGKIWDSRNPLWMRIFKMFWVVLLGAVMVGALIAIAIRFYRVLTNKF